MPHLLHSEVLALLELRVTLALQTLLTDRVLQRTAMEARDEERLPHHVAVVANVALVDWLAQDRLI